MSGARSSIVQAALAVLLLIVTAATFARDARRDYTAFQAHFREMVAARSGAAAAAAVPGGVQQIWLAGARRADRCTTCHQAVTWKGYEQAPEPWRTHSQAILAAHPVERFGCTLCHAGQGWAVDTAAAHGTVDGWSEPLLDTVADGLGADGFERHSARELGCNICHRFDARTNGMPILNRAKRLIEDKGCRACHRINGRGGIIGPDLTWAGGKHPEQYDYSRLPGRPSVARWYAAHFRDPRALVPDSVMPNFHLSAPETASLSLLMLSWRPVPLDRDLVGTLPQADVEPAAARAARAEMLQGRGAWFVRTGCQQCHDVSVFGVKSPTPIGPDLSTAADDTERRFSRPIETFMVEPVGTMRVVLARQVMLSPVQRQEAARELRAAWAAYQVAQAAATTAQQAGRRD